MQSIDKELDYLNQMVLKMTDLVEKNMKIAQDFYLTKKSDLEINDDLVDKYERLVEETCLDIMIKERPFAKDLRRLTGILTLVEDLERIGDYAVDLAKVSMYIPENEHIDFKISDYFSDTIKKMITEVVEAYINNDKKKAIEIYESDEAIDKKYYDIFTQIMDKMNSGEITNNIGVQTLFMIKYFERAGDHINNICENIMYLKSGEFFKRRLNN